MNPFDQSYRLPRGATIEETYKADGIYAVVRGRFRTCRLEPAGHGRYRRITQNGSVHGRRSSLCANYAAAVEEGLAWANRKLRVSR